MASARRIVSRVVAVVLLALGLVCIAAGVGLREFVVLSVPFALAGVVIVIEAVHLFFTGRIT
jgi:hypothetical protein